MNAAEGGRKMSVGDERNGGSEKLTYRGLLHDFFQRPHRIVSPGPLIVRIISPMYALRRLRKVDEKKKVRQMRQLEDWLEKTYRSWGRCTTVKPCPNFVRLLPTTTYRLSSWGAQGLRESDSKKMAVRE